MLPAAKEDDANADQRPNLGLDLDWIWTGLGLSSISPTIHCTGGPYFFILLNSNLASTRSEKPWLVYPQAAKLAAPMVRTTVEADSATSHVQLVHVKVPRTPCFRAFSAPEDDMIRAYMIAPELKIYMVVGRCLSC